MENATSVIWKAIVIAQKCFRKLDVPELMSEVADGAIYIDGVRIRETEEEDAA